MNAHTHQRIVDLLSCSVRNLELDIPSIYRHAGPGAHAEAAVIRSLQFSLGLMVEAISLADENTARAITARAEKIQDAIADHRKQLAEWIEVEGWIVVAEGENETKH
ncbi:hypothetical protein [Paraburkholderia caffeinilytica]|uniref:hypothetical protein n=1 Tax=Paraburkholderia caffeinilytica TaxID=1761016 RepID=UPI0038BBE64A